MDNRPIGIFDSGLGGLTAVAEVLSAMPEEDIIYFGDTGRVPYGVRSRETVIKYARQDIAFLQTFDIKAIVIACGTVSSAGMELAAGAYDIPIIGVVRPSVERAAKVTRTGRVGIIGTPGTIRSGAYTRMLREYLPAAEVVEQACPLFVPLVENGRVERGDIVIETMAREYLAPVCDFGIDTLIMGCTHYPLLEGVIRDVVGPDVALVSPGREAARYARSLLGETGRTACREKTGRARYFVSDNVEGFAKQASLFLGQDIAENAEFVDIGAYAAE